MFNITICCDCPNQVNILNDYLVKFSYSHKFKYKLHKYNFFNDLINNPINKIDILLLNVNLNNKKIIFDIYKKLNTSYNKIQVIFIPELIDFMLNGFYLKDFKYILKPLKYSSFEDELLSCLNDLNDVNKPIEKNKFSENNSHMLGGFPTKSVLFIESRNNSCIVHTRNSFDNVPHSLDVLEKVLCSSTFFRCHSNYLINLSKVNKLNRTSILINNKTIPVSDHKFIELKNRLLSILKII